MKISPHRKLFLRPLFANKTHSFLAIFLSILQGLLAPATARFLATATQSFETQNPDLFRKSFRILLSYLSFFLTLKRVFVHNRVIFYNEAVKRIKRHIHKKIFKMENNAVESFGTGRIQSIRDDGLSSRNNLLKFLVGRIPRTLITIIGSFILIRHASPKIFRIALFFSVIWIFISAFLFRKTDAPRSEFKKKLIALSRQKIRMLMAKFEILSNARGDAEIKKVDDLMDQRAFFAKKIVVIQNLIETALSRSIEFRQLLVIALIAPQIFQNQLTIADFVLITGAIASLQNVTNGIIDLFSQLFQHFVHISKLFNFLDKTPEIQGYDTGLALKFRTGKISVKNLHFGYNSDQKLFQNFSLEIPAGKKTALVGHSGSGKSTLLKLLAGRLRADSGQILIDDQPLSEIALKTFYPHLGYLSQDPGVFDGTIFENLTFGISHTPSDEEIQTAISRANCDFVREFPAGLQTEIGERGIKLSGGQRQRIAIAKLFLKNPKILFLDEPTSALDSFSEDTITTAMNELFIDRTVVIIAHRLQTVKSADQIFLLDHGQILESGTHAQLIQKKWDYFKMVELQATF